MPIAEVFKDFTIDIIIVDGDVEPILHFGEHRRDSHRIEFRKRAEQTAVGFHAQHGLLRLGARTDVAVRTLLVDRS